jgi:spore coat protein CotH
VLKNLLLVFISIFVFNNSFSQNFYDLNTIQKIEIQFPQANWDEQLDVLKLTTDKYLMADWVKINGKAFDSIGVKYKGNSSYDSTFKKNPIHIELNTYKEQDYQGYVDIKLGNSYADPSMIREVLAYHLLDAYMDCPKANFVELYINRKYMGIYSNSESINKRFCSSRFYSSDNVFMKGNPNITPGPTVKSNLKYLGSDSLAYKDYYEKKSKNGWNDFVKLCDTITNFPNSAANVIDIDRSIWMLAYNNFTINLDSYNGAFAQNYYLYKDDTKRYNPIIWDLNMAFGGFPFAGSPNNGMGTLSIANMQNLSIFYHETHTDWPLINVVLKNATYKKMYVAHLKTIIQDYFLNNEYSNIANKFRTLIDQKVQADSHKFYNYNQFKNAMTDDVNIGSYFVPGISKLMDSRVNYIKSSNEYNKTAPSITNLNTLPIVPAYNAPITISANITNALPTNVFLRYRFDLRQKFENIRMFDDGNHGDGMANDHVFGITLNMQGANLTYYIYAENEEASKFSPERAEHEFYTINLPTDTLKIGDLVINEFLAINDKSDLNEYGIYSDWIELYNNTNKDINLTGYFLSNDHSNLKKYPFDVNTTIAPKSYLMVWADDLKTTTKYAHCGFTLSGSTGQLIFSNPKNAILDSINYKEQLPDISVGRCPNGTGKFISIDLPTFKESNSFFCTNSTKNIKGHYSIMNVYPNPASTNIHFVSKQLPIHAIYIINSQGKVIKEVEASNQTYIMNIEGLANGIYFYRINNHNQAIIGQGKIAIYK